jgi:hypothetical protein
MGSDPSKLDHFVEELRHEDLRCIELGDEAIGDAGALLLAEALSTSECAVTAIDVHGCELTDFGFGAICEAIAANAHTAAVFDTLDCSFNGITTDGAHSIASLLLRQSLARLATIDAGSNAMGDAGALAIADALRFNRTVSTLKLWNNQIGARGCAALAASFSDDESGCVLVELALMGNAGFSNAVRSTIVEAKQRRRGAEPHDSAGDATAAAQARGTATGSLIDAALALAPREARGEANDDDGLVGPTCQACSSCQPTGAAGSAARVECVVDLKRGVVHLDAPAWAALREKFGDGTLSAQIVAGRLTLGSGSGTGSDDGAEDEGRSLLAA